MGEVKALLREETWQVTRIGVLEEVELDNGGIRFRVQIRDENRLPFMSKWFNDPVPASDFLERFRDGRVEPRERR